MSLITFLPSDRLEVDKEVVVLVRPSLAIGTDIRLRIPVKPMGGISTVPRGEKSSLTG